MTATKPRPCAACAWQIGVHEPGCEASRVAKEIGRLHKQSLEEWTSEQQARWSAEDEQQAKERKASK